MTYAGHANYATWATILWLTNDQPTYTEARRVANRADDHYTAADELRTYTIDLTGADDLPASLAADLLQSALGSVDWLDVLDSLRDDDRDDEPDDDTEAEEEEETQN